MRREGNRTFPAYAVRTFLSPLCQFTLFLLVAVPVSAAGESSSVPMHFSAYIGGFLGASYTVELHDGILTYTSSESGHRNEKHAKITPTSGEWRVFRQTLDDLKVWQWRADYPSQGTQDGTQWSLHIAYVDHVLRTHGDNNYPDASGRPIGKSDPTELFKRYLAAIRMLIGGRSFE